MYQNELTFYHFSRFLSTQNMYPFRNFAHVYNLRAFINFHVPISDLATEVICTEKANGEAAHISARYIGNKFYVIVGSKNVHLMLGKFFMNHPVFLIQTQRMCIFDPMYLKPNCV